MAEEAKQTQKSESKDTQTLQKGDFVEIEFTGKLKDTGEVFDSNRKEDLQKMPNPDLTKAKPLVYSLGHGMFLQGIDDNLIGQESNKKEHTIELTPENAFGKRDSNLIKRVPMNVFTEHNLTPVRGGTFNFDGQLGKVLSVSGGRVLVDFNHPIAGKDVIYDIEVKRKVDDINEQLKAFNDIVFRKELKYELKDEKVVYKKPQDEQTQKMLDMFKPKFKEIFGKELEIKGEENSSKDNQKNSEESVNQQS
ncbi:MAG: peptidylprolyl isomerase [Candidatus Pacearchaeota archaeon]